MDLCRRKFFLSKKNLKRPLDFWTPEKQKLLLSLYLDTTLSWEKRAEQIGCHKIYCLNELLKLGMFNKPKKSAYWGPSDSRSLIILVIKFSLKKISWEKIARKIGWGAGVCEAEFIALQTKALIRIQNNNFQSKSPFWTQEKCVQLLKLCKEFTFSWAQIAEKIGQTERSCRHKAQKLYMRTLPKKYRLNTKLRKIKC